jgi:MFS family permease
MPLRRARLHDLRLPLPRSSPSLPPILSLTRIQPEMIESFGIPQTSVAKWAGITSAVFSLSQCLTAVLWGRASDYFGRKPMILIGLSFTMLASLVWGMSTSLPMAILSRAMAGGCNGNGMSRLASSVCSERGREGESRANERSGYYQDYGRGNGSRERTTT